MTSKQLADRALSLADLQNSIFITYEDIVNSLNESYRDVYSRITASGDDYFVTEYSVTIDSTMLNGPFEYLVPLPTDVYKVRTIDYLYNGVWQNMPKFSLSMRNRNPSEPHYRLREDGLWIIGTLSGSTAFDIRVLYYPPAEEITVSDTSLYFGSSISASDLNTITSPYYVDIQTYNGTGMVSNRCYFYYDTTTSDLVVENYDTKINTTLVDNTSGITNVVYYNGYVYYLLGGQIYYASWAPDDSAPIFAALPSGPSSVVNFQVLSGGIVYSTATDTLLIPVIGPYNTPTTLYAFPTLAYTIVGGYSAYLNASGELYINGVFMGSTWDRLVSDGESVWLHDSSYVVQKYSVDFTVPATPAVTLLQSITNVKYLGSAVSSKIATVGFENPSFQGISTANDYDLSYPLNTNETIEIMAYQMAIDFRRKQNQDITTLMVRKTELDTRFNETIRKDDYTVEKIRHAYAGQIGVNGNGW